MNELITIQNGQAVVSSRKIADDFNKRHDHTLRDVESIKKDVPNFGEMFFETTEPDSYGREQKVYLMNRDGFTLLAMGFTGSDAMQWKLKYIQAFNEMEKQIQFKLPKTYSEALRLAADQAEQIENQAKQLEEAKPKIEFFDAVADSKDAIPMDNVAKVLDVKGYGRNNLFKFLRNQKVLQHNNLPYQKYVNNGHFRVIEQEYPDKNGNIHISLKTLVHQRGLDFIQKLLSAKAVSQNA